MTVISEEIATALKGACSSEVELSILRARLPSGLVPEWLLVVLKEFRLAGSSFSLAESEDESGLGAELKWFTPIQMVSEALECEPGLSVVAMGFCR